MRVDIVLGTLTLDVVDMPFFECHFSPSPAFEEVRPLFAIELALLDDSEAVAAGTWDQAYRAPSMPSTWHWQATGSGLTTSSSTSMATVPGSATEALLYLPVKRKPSC
jgi:hypothetical protein